MQTQEEIQSHWTNVSEPLVSILCPTYNHEKYIAKAICSFIEQDTEFPIEVIIHDDASTDQTPNIINSYAEKYNKIVRPILRKNNIFSQGKKIIPAILPYANGKYIAICEGDDYWTDPNKLQKQIDIMEKEADIAICFHNVKVIYDQEKMRPHPLFGDSNHGLQSSQKPKRIATIKDLLNGNYIPTPSVVFRARLIDSFPKWFNNCAMGDWPLHILNTLNGGLIQYIDEIMGVYRVHAGSMWSSSERVEVLIRSILSAEQIKKGLYNDYRKDMDKTLIRWHREIISLMIKSNKPIIRRLTQIRPLLIPKPIIFAFLVKILIDSKFGK